MRNLFYKDWHTLISVVLTTTIAFLTLFLFIRISGKRTLSSLSGFDYVVAVAIGSTLSYMMLGLVPLIEGAVVLFLIIVFQYVFAWSARFSKKSEKLINSTPQILYIQNTFCEGAMAREAITKDELFAVVRLSGIEYFSEVKAIVLEINGEISVIRYSQGNGESTIEILK